MVVTDLDLAAAEATAKEIGGDATALALDVTDAAQAKSVAEDVAQRHGAIDVWVSNAGISKMQRVPRRHAGRPAPHPGRQPGGHLPVRAGRRRVMMHAASGSGRRDRQRRLDGRQAGPRPLPRRLRGLQVRRRRPHPGDGLRARAARHHASTPSAPATSTPRCRTRELGWEAALRGTTEDTVRQLWIDDTPLAAWKRRRTSREPSPSWPARTPASSPARHWPSTAAPSWTNPGALPGRDPKAGLSVRGGVPGSGYWMLFRPRYGR